VILRVKHAISTIMRILVLLVWKVNTYRVIFARLVIPPVRLAVILQVAQAV
jgi:hypothetical protein